MSIENPPFEIDDSETKNTDGITVEEHPIKDVWSRPIEFLLSCISQSVGLGNVWRFPFVAYENGGGAFIIPYVLLTILIGLPLYYMELCMGQFSSYGCIKMWDVCPALRGVGYGQMIATVLVVTYFVSLVALSIFYFCASFTATFPWSMCPANVSHCIDASSNFSTMNITSDFISAAEIYFENDVQKRHPNGLEDGIFAPDWRLTLCLLAAWIIIYLVLSKGVKSLGKAAYFTALFPYVVLLILFGRGASLPGAVKGIQYFITPKWEMLLHPRVWYNAVAQSFFSLGVGYGVLTMFSSHNNFRHNIYRDATIITAMDTLTSLLAGFTIFAILGHLADQMGIDDIDLVIKGGGTSLAFVSYPSVLSRFIYVPQLFAVLFFLMLFTFGVGTSCGMTGAFITVICDAFPRAKRYVVTAVVCILGFFVGLFYVTPQGQYMLDLIDFYAGTFIIYVLAFIEVVAVQWVYGYKNFVRDIKFMLGRSTGIYWAFCWKFFIPVLLFVVFVVSLVDMEPLKSGDYVFGIGANAFGFVIAAIAVGLVPLFVMITILKNKSNYVTLYEAAKKSFQPNKGWCPKNQILAMEYRMLLENEETKEV